MSDNRTDLPSPNSNNFSQRVRETLMTYLGRQGNPLDRGLTLRDLLSAGLLKLRDGVTLRPGVQPPIEPGPAIDGAVDLTPPPQPTGFTATAGITNIIVEHDPPVFPMGGGYLRTRLYGATRQPGDPLPTFDDAVEIAQFTGQVYAHSTNPSTTWHLWIKWETKAEVLSPTPAGGTNGVEVRTGEDVALLLEALQGQISESQLYQDLGARIDLIDGPDTLPGSVAQRIAAEATARAQAILDEAAARGAAISAEAAARAQAILDESAARGAAISAEAAARQAGDSSLASQITTLTASVSANAAAIANEAAVRADGDAAEAVARNTLAAQLRGNYTGSDINQVTTGLIYQERIARTNADSALAQDITALTAAVTNNVNSLTAAIQSESTARANADNALSSQITTLAAQVDTDVADLYAAIQSEATTRTTQDTALAQQINTLATQVDSNIAAVNAAIQTESTTRASADVTLSQQITILQAELDDEVANRTAAISTEATARATQDAVLAGQINTLSATLANEVSTLNAAIQSESTARTSADSALTTQLTTLQSTVTTNNTTLTAAIQTEATTRAAETGELFAKYTVKIDNNGYVSGFGLASTANNATPFSEFIVRADSFAIASPSGPDIDPAEPFFVRTTPTTINGVSVPAGVYIQDGFIQNGTITNAKIANAAIDDAKVANLSASKLTAGSIAVGSYIQSSNYVAGSQGWRINGNGNAELSNATVRGTVFANNGQFLGTLLGGSATTYTNGLGLFSGWSGAATDANYRWRVGSPTGARIQWTGSAIEVYNASNQLTLSSGGVDWTAITGQPAGIYNSNISINSNGTLSGAGSGQVSLSGLGAGAFATLSQITAANISTYIASAAIGTAQIANASITNAKIGSLAVGSAQIADGAITNAKIGNASITTAKIGEAQIDTLRIAGNAVTIPVGVSGSTDSVPPQSTVTVASTSIFLPEAAVVIVIGQCRTELSATGSSVLTRSGNSTVTFYMDGVAVRSYYDYVQASPDTTDKATIEGVVILTQWLNAGTHTFSFTVQRAGDSQGVSVRYVTPSIAVIAARR